MSNMMFLFLYSWQLPPRFSFASLQLDERVSPVAIVKGEPPTPPEIVFLKIPGHVTDATALVSDWSLQNKFTDLHLPLSSQFQQ
ncbi:unnamed protein product [Mesocestoides corti]|uniref:Uncharacterized protein n=2 Tax=Mesocestoides corti TaxID=53468 RepID=A0A0R3U4P3_MESCO|nr:unnamed protein product [Mesocestoides corti]